MAQAEKYRLLVEARAGGACEYCRLLQAATGVTFHIEHFLPRSGGGQTTLSNLVLSCPGCNLAKGQRISGEDEKGQTQGLFNPCAYDPWLLGWHLHFTLHGTSGFIVPRTSVGEATVNTLDVNSSRRVFARRVQIRVGLIA